MLNTDKLYIVTFPVNYPLFSVILHLKKIYDDDLSNPDTVDTVIESWTNRLDKLLDEALLNFKKNDKITIKRDHEAENFVNALELIRELVNGIFTKFPKRVQQLTHKPLVLLLLLKKNRQLYLLNVHKKPEKNQNQLQKVTKNPLQWLNQII